MNEEEFWMASSNGTSTGQIIKNWMDKFNITYSDKKFGTF